MGGDIKFCFFFWYVLSKIVIYPTYFIIKMFQDKIPPIYGIVSTEFYLFMFIRNVFLELFMADFNISRKKLKPREVQTT